VVRPVVRVTPRPDLAVDEFGCWVAALADGRVYRWRNATCGCCRFLEQSHVDVTEAVESLAAASSSPLPALVRYALAESTYWRRLALGWLEAGFPSGPAVDLPMLRICVS
jgi:hypothetical protein